MGISVVSSASLNTQGTGTAAPGTGDSNALDFLALFTQQLSGQSLTDALTLGLADNGNEQADTGEAAAGSLDQSSLLGAAGLLPFFTPTPTPSQRPTDAAALGGGKDGDQIAGIIGHLELNAGRNIGEEQGTGATGADSGLTAAGNGVALDTANIAAESQSNSGNSQNFGAALAAQSALTQTAQSRVENATPQAQVETPLHDSGWSHDFSEKVVWLAKNDQQVAQININPPQLGPMHITLNLNGEQASALFVSPNAEVRQAIADAMPQLREMLAGAGINLGQANVGSQMPQQNTGTSPQSSEPSRSGGDNAILRADQEQESASSLSIVRGGRGMVDLFA